MHESYLGHDFNTAASTIAAGDFGKPAELATRTDSAIVDLSAWRRPSAPPVVNNLLGYDIVHATRKRRGGNGDADLVHSE